jgi:hypothetical protein
MFWTLLWPGFVERHPAGNHTAWKQKENAEHAPTKRARITDWSPPTLADIKALLGVMINMGLHPMWYYWLLLSSMGAKMPFFSDVFPRDEFLLLFWNLHFAHTEGQGKLKKEELIKSVLDKIRSKCIQHYSPKYHCCCWWKHNFVQGEGVFQNIQSHEASKVWTENVCTIW